MMKLIVVLFFSLAVFCAGQSVRSNPSDTASVRLDTRISNPRLERIQLKGNKLIVTGQDFADGARIIINNEQVVTRNDFESPSTRLIAKKGGKMIPFDSIVDIYVENPDSGFSLSLEYFRRRSFFSLVLPVGDYPYSVKLQLGDYVLVINLERATSLITASNIILRVFDVPLPSNNYWSFQAVQPGNSRFYAEEATGGGGPIIVFYNIGIIVE